jgi:hypothetical protein
VLNYNSDPTEMFEYFPKAPVVIAPGRAPEVFVIKRDLGIRERGTFDNNDPLYSRSISFRHDPASDCHDGGGDDWVVEC